MSSPVIRTIIVPAGGIAVETVSGRIFKVVSATAGFTISADGGAALPMSSGRGFGSESSARFDRLVFTDTSGSANTVEFYVGDEPLIVPEPTTVTLDPASASAITPAQQTLTPAAADITTSTNYADKKSIQVICISGTATAGGITLQSGDSVSWSVFRHQDKLATVTVVPTGGTTRVITLG